MRSVIEGLEAEWEELGRSAQARRALARWAEAHGVLRGLVDLHHLLDARRQPWAAPALLAALAALAPGDELAARTLLHALMPGLVTLARDTGYDDPDALDELVSLAWERIRTYPTSRVGSVAANVLWDVRKRYRAHRVVDAPAAHGQVTTPAECSWARAEDGRPAEDEALERVAFDEFIDVARRGVVNRRSVALVIRSRLLGDPLNEIADEQNTTRVRVQQRRWRAEVRLRHHLPAAG